MQGSGAGGRVFCRYTPRHTITLYTVPTPSLEEGNVTHTHTHTKELLYFPYIDDVTTDIHDIEWNGIIWNSPTRKLVNQSHGMYVCMCVHTYVCMYVCMCVRMYVRTFVCMYVEL